MRRALVKSARPSPQAKGPLGRSQLWRFVGARELARSQFRREALGYLALPALYGALMTAGVFVLAPTLVLLSLALVFMLLLQARSTGAAAAVAGRARRSGQTSHALRGAIEAADRAFVRQVNYTVAANVLGYLAFLWALDLHLRAVEGGRTGPTALLPGALLAIVLIVGGHEGARIAAWRGVPELPEGRLPGLPDSGPSPREYLEWRAAVDAKG